MKNLKIYSLDESKTLGSVLKNDNSSLMLKYLMEGWYHYEKLGKKISPHHRPPAVLFYHFKKIKSLQILSSRLIAHATRKQGVIQFNASSFILIVPQEHKEVCQKSKELEEFFNKLSKE